MKKFFSWVMLAAAVTFIMPAEVFAAGENEANVLTGEYVAVVNTSFNSEESQSTGILDFDNTGTMSSGLLTLNEENPVNDVVNKPERTVKSRSALQGSPQGYYLGQESFFYDKTFVCIFDKGLNAFIWMEKGLKAQYDTRGINTAAVGKEISDMYSGKPYAVLSKLAGSEAALAGVMKDATGKLSILIERTGGSSGYYAGEDGITAIHINMVEPDRYYTGSYGKYDGLIVHETQHAIFRHLACGGSKSLAHELSWINEGLSVAAMDYYWGGDDPTNWLKLINDNLQVRCGSSLIYSSYRNSSAVDYSMPYLFIRYLANQRTKGYNPVGMISAFYGGRADGDTTEEYVNSVLSRAGLKGKNGDPLKFNEAIANFYVAAMAQESTGAYGFYDDPIVKQAVTDYPVYLGSNKEAVSLPGSAGIIIKAKGGRFTVPSDVGADIRFIPFNVDRTAQKPAGSGTEDDPYRIETAYELGYMNEEPGASYKLMNNVDMSFGGVYFPPADFTGVFDGGGKAVSNLEKSFVNTNSGIIKNLTVNGFGGEFSSWTGALSSFNQGVITDCRATGVMRVKLTSTNAFSLPAFGAMTAQNDISGIIKNCFSDADITVDAPANTDYVGAIAGLNKYEIRNCYSLGSIKVNNPSGEGVILAGGIVGEQYSSFNLKPVLQNCYSAAAVQVLGGSGNSVGRIAGSVQQSSELTSCYGLEGMAAVGKGRTDGAAAKTQEQMKTEETYKGWDFGSVWKMAAGTYPSFAEPESLTANLIRTEYYIGEAPDLYGATITADGKKVPLTQEMISGFDSATAGEKVITVSYRGKSASVSVKIKEPVNVTFLEVYTKPGVEYFQGEKFSPKGSRLRATVDGRQNVYISSGYTVKESGALELGTTSVTYTYGGLSAQLPITVKPKTAVKIVVTQGAKLDYFAGDKLDLSQLQVQLVYGDGTKSSVLGIDKFSENNVHISKGLSEELQTEAVLKAADNKADLYVYCGSKTPQGGGIPFDFIGELSVTQSIYMEDESFELPFGKESWLSSKQVMGTASGTLKSQLVSGSLPSGIKLDRAPRWEGDMFGFYGTPTVENQQTTAVYKLTDSGTGKTAQVSFSFKVVAPSKECNILSYKIWDTALPGTQYQGVVDNVKNTVDIRLPKSFESSNKINVEIKASRGSQGSITEMGKTLASISRLVTITAEAGNKKSYQINIVTGQEEVKLPSPSGVFFKNGVAAWQKVENASGYTVSLYKGEKPGTAAIKTVTVDGGVCSVDFSGVIKESGKYVFTVAANGKSGFLTSEKAVSPVFEYTLPVLSKLVIAVPPKKTSYTVGEKFDKTGMLVRAYYTDGKVKDVTSYSFSPSGALTAANKAVVVRYKEGAVTKEATQVIKVNNPSLVSIKIITPPKKTTYVAGQKFEKAGMIVRAYYANGTSKEISSYTFSPGAALTTANTRVLVSYKEGSKTASLYLNIKVVPVALTSLKITSPPKKTTYVSGQKFNKTGMAVRAYFNNGDSKAVTTYTVLPTAALSTKNTRAAVTYKYGSVTKTVYQPIKVVPLAVTGIKVAVPPRKTTYVTGQKFDKTGMVVKLCYNDGTEKTVTGYTVTPSAALSTGNTRVKISYRVSSSVKTVYQSIRVVPVAISGIKIVTPPKKTVYRAGEKFNRKGMVVRAIYNNGTSKLITTYTVSPSTALKKTNKYVKIYYKSGSVIKSALQKITVR